MGCASAGTASLLIFIFYVLLLFFSSVLETSRRHWESGALSPYLLFYTPKRSGLDGCTFDEVLKCVYHQRASVATQWSGPMDIDQVAPWSGDLKIAEMRRLHMIPPFFLCREVLEVVVRQGPCPWNTGAFSPPTLYL